METTERNHTNLVWTLATLIILGLVWGMYWKNDRMHSSRYDQIEQRADSLLSVKFLLEGDNRELKRQLETMVDDNAYLDKRINKLHEQIGQRERSEIALRHNRIQQTRSIRSLNDSLSQLKLIRDSLENQMAAMHDKLNWQIRSNALLISQKKELEQKQKVLNARLVATAPHSAITGDAFRVAVSKANKKVTAKAKKAKTLTVSLNVPNSFSIEGKQEVYLSLTDMQRNPMLPVLRNKTVTLPNINEHIPVHAEQQVNFDRNPQRLSFSLTPDVTLKSGTYRASIFTKDMYLGSVEFQLRDSFWFF
ncbi:hypothetical protein GCM10028807_55520 [Spirosoma daeguense]